MAKNSAVGGLVKMSRIACFSLINNSLQTVGY